MVTKAAQHQRLGDVFAMTPRQLAAYLHFRDRLDVQDELTALATARLAQSDAKTLGKHIKGLMP